MGSVGVGQPNRSRERPVWQRVVQQRGMGQSIVHGSEGRRRDLDFSCLHLGHFGGFGCEGGELFGLLGGLLVDGDVAGGLVPDVPARLVLDLPEVAVRVDVAVAAADGAVGVRGLLAGVLAGVVHGVEEVVLAVVGDVEFGVGAPDAGEQAQEDDLVGGEKTRLNEASLCKKRSL